MGKGADLARAAKSIEEALRAFVNQGEQDKVHVFESSPGLLRAVVGSGRFRSMGASERQKTIWKYLKEHVNEADLHPCWGVHPLDLEEYAEEFPRSISSSVPLYIQGEEIAGDDE